MPGKLLHIGAMVALSMCQAAFAGATPLESALHPEIAARLSRSASGLFHNSSRISSNERIAGKRAPQSLSLLIVGVDFSDSLIVGRSNQMPQFVGWPNQTRRSELIPGTDIPMFSAHDAAYFDIQMRKVADYFTTVSFAQLQLNWTVHPDIVNVGRFADDPRTRMGWYGDEDSSGVRLVDLSRDVIERIDPEVDFSLYDTLVLIHAGAGQETDILGDSPEQIFSNYLDRRDFEEAVQAGYLSEPRLSSQEADIEHVLILPESESQDPYPPAGFFGFFDTRGVYCFELGLRLGMLNLGDFTPAGRPDSQGIGNFGLMGYGLFTGLGIVPSAPCALNRQLMGWVQPVDVRAAGDIRLGAMGPDGAAVSDTLLVRVPISDREYFLLEYRLQDPDGDLYFSFDDLNANRLPDYFDADSAFGDGTPTSPFDPNTDTWESTAGAEWDWFMSENDARSLDRCMRAGGSGLYIWHIDERIIRDSIEGGGNVVNADPRRKGVDVEEADRIQDLDSSRPSEFFLGWDRDAWRGEDVAEFGPTSDPSSSSADGQWTGIRIHSMSKVSGDTTRVDGFCREIEFWPTMRFRVDFVASASTAIRVAATHRFVDTEVVGEPKLVDLAAPGLPHDDVLEIVHASSDATVYAWRGDLSEWLDGDLDAGTLGVLARATNISPPQVRAAPAIGDLNGDGIDELVLVGDDGLYVFQADGNEFVDGDLSAASFGLAYAFADSGSGVGPPMLEEGRIFALRRLLSGQAQLLAIDSATWTAQSAERDVELLSDGLALFESGSGLGVGYAFQDAAGSGLAVHAFDDIAATTTVNGSSLAPQIGIASWSDGSQSRGYWFDAAASLLERSLDAAANFRSAASTQFPLSAAAVSPLQRLAPTGRLLCFASGRRLFALDANLRLRTGFPYLADFEGETTLGAPVQAAPILVDLNDDESADILWADPVGRVHAVDRNGRLLPGYPIVGPAEPLGSPAVGQLDLDPELELVCLGRFGELIDIDAPLRSVRTRDVATLQVFELDAAASSFAPWSQGRGDAANRSRQTLASTLAAASDGGVFAADTLLLHPHPATGSSVRVRVSLRQSAAVRATLYNLEGEVVAEGPLIQGLAGGAYDESVDISDLVSGYYLCRVHSESESVRTPLTVVR